MNRKTAIIMIMGRTVPAVVMTMMTMATTAIMRGNAATATCMTMTIIIMKNAATTTCMTMTIIMKNAAMTTAIIKTAITIMAITRMRYS